MGLTSIPQVFAGYASATAATIGLSQTAQQIHIWNSVVNATLTATITTLAADTITVVVGSASDFEAAFHDFTSVSINSTGDWRCTVSRM